MGVFRSPDRQGPAEFPLDVREFRLAVPAVETGTLSGSAAVLAFKGEGDSMLSIRHEARGARHAPLGKVSSNRVIPSAEITLIEPPCASTIDLTIARPSPAPSPARCRAGSTR